MDDNRSRLSTLVRPMFWTVNKAKKAAASSNRMSLKVVLSVPQRPPCLSSATESLLSAETSASSAGASSAASFEVSAHQAWLRGRQERRQGGRSSSRSGER